MQNHILLLLLCFQILANSLQSQEADQSLTAADVETAIAASQPGQAEEQPRSSGIIFQSADGGQTWQEISDGLPNNFSSMFVSAVNNGDVYLGSNWGLYCSTKPPAVKFWEKTEGIVGTVTGIFPGRAGPWACSFGIGFFQKIGCAGGWAAMHNSLEDKTVHCVLENPEGTIFVSSNRGIYKSDDGAHSWQQVYNKGRITHLTNADGALFAGGSMGLLRSTDNGEHWEPMLTDGGAVLKTVQIENNIVALIEGTSPAIEALSKSKINQLLSSDNGGKTWRRIDQNIQPGGVIYDIKQAGQYLYCINRVGVYCSSDLGKTWKLVLSAPKDSRYNLTASGDVIIAVLISEGC